MQYDPTYRYFGSTSYEYLVYELTPEEVFEMMVDLLEENTSNLLLRKYGVNIPDNFGFRAQWETYDEIRKMASKNSFRYIPLHAKIKEEYLLNFYRDPEVLIEMFYDQSNGEYIPKSFSN